MTRIYPRRVWKTRRSTGRTGKFSFTDQSPEFLGQKKVKNSKGFSTADVDKAEDSLRAGRESPCASSSYKRRAETVQPGCYPQGTVMRQLFRAPTGGLSTGDVDKPMHSSLTIPKILAGTRV
ncbi:hypothetical protein [Bordetella ansorpii]|uniref:hypothetical protein n=1 Tax=Bordetella ansorpii TaxID=288768 RepID=UPI0012E74593|nr:hypothetical protein [Bordetella ansorpii]